jgi:hypothetical protein
MTELNVAEYGKNLALVSSRADPVCGSVKLNVLLGATKPADARRD